MEEWGPCTCSLIHLFMTSLVRTLGDTPDTFPRSQLFCAAWLAAHSFRFPLSWLWLLKSFCLLGEWEFIPHCALPGLCRSVTDLTVGRSYLEYCLPCLPEGQTLMCSWLSRAPLGLRDQDFLLPSHHFLTASSSLSSLPASTVSPRSMSLINHMHSYFLVQGLFLRKSHLREAPSIHQAMWLCCSVRDHNRKIKNKMSISFKMSLDQQGPTV